MALIVVVVVFVLLFFVSTRVVRDPSWRPVVSQYLSSQIRARRFWQFFFVCPHSFIFPWAVESSPLQFLALE